VQIIKCRRQEERTKKEKKGRKGMGQKHKPSSLKEEANGDLRKTL